METGFTVFHPAVQLLFFVSVLTVTMMIMNPVLLVISTISAVLYIAYTGGISALAGYARMTAFSFVIIMVINPLISHKGITILTYLPDGNPLTLESVIFGVGAAVMLSCVFAWFYTVNRIFTSEKVICIFGNFMPKIALLISMTLSYSEKFMIQFKSVKAVQSTLGYNTEKVTKLMQLKKSVTILSIMIQWAIESVVDTADSMKSRGYGLKKRTGYTVYRVFPADIAVSVFIILCDTVMLIAYMNGITGYSYYPYFSLENRGLVTLAVYIVFAMLCLMPLYIDITEDIKWRSIRSKT